MSHNRCKTEGRHVCQEPSGKKCIEPGCDEPAGTKWTPYWCPQHDQERLDRVTTQLENLVANKDGRT